MSEIRETPPPEPSSIRGGSDIEDQITLSTSAPAAGQVVVEVGGEVDMLTSPHLRAAVLEQFETAGVHIVVLVLDEVTFLGTSGLAVLIEVREAAQVANVTLRLVCTARRVLRPLTIAGLLPLFDVRKTLSNALAS